ncbi:MAG: hypothetical protein EOO48_00045 [Flavobacterium sp.]|nr:MAG: hypothetical protein EOO48_00045 [Flavobacterium sp.]
MLFVVALSHAQQHFSGINTSSHTSIVNGTMNPAEYPNIATTYSINVLGLSVNASSNKVGFSDLLNGNDIENLIFQGSDAANFRIDGELLLPGVTYKMDKWAFALTTKAYAKMDLVDIDVHIGDAIANSGVNSIVGSTVISNNYNQRVSGTTWGEVALSAARTVYEDDTNRFNGGLSLKILFPGSYANFGADRFHGTINNTLGNGTLTNTQANLNIAYSGNLGEDFTDFSDYTSSLFGRLGGFAADIGINYQMKDAEPGKYKVNAGLAIRNMGSMTFKSANNSSTNYRLTIQGAESLDLNQFQDVTSLEEVEQILLNSGYLDKTDNSKTDFKVRLPAVFSAYADVKIIPSLYATIYTQQKMRKNDENDQIGTENVFSLTPRYVAQNLEVFVPLASNEISGFSAGVGFRAYGFYIGSPSIISALLSDSKQADVFIGYSFGLQ